MNWQIIVKRNVAWDELTKVEDFAYQEVLRDKSKKILVLSEPLPTYTCGRSVSDEELFRTKQNLEDSNTRVVRGYRGGLITYHGPGQLLVFPILHLPTHGFQRLGVRSFMDQFRSAAQTGLQDLGAQTTVGEEPFGLFVEDAKIASFGLSFKNAISTHGMAIYVTPQQKRFQAINPCGVVGGKTIALQDLVPHCTWEDLAGNITESVKNGLKST